LTTGIDHGTNKKVNKLKIQNVNFQRTDAHGSNSKKVPIIKKFLLIIPYRVNRTNSNDSQCYFDQDLSSHGHRTGSTGRNATSAAAHMRMKESSKRARSRSTDHLPNVASTHINTELNSMSLRKMLRPVHTAPDSPVTSPENTRGHKMGGGGLGSGGSKKGMSGGGGSNGVQLQMRRMEKSNSSGGGCMSEPEFYGDSNQGQQQQQLLRPSSKAKSEQRIVTNGCNYNNLVVSPTSDDVDIFDSHCFATTPSSSNENSDADEPASPTSQLLIEYEEHLRNTLEKDSESFSLHTFEALLSRSMENLGI
jgi:hypothetical protein